MPSILIDDWETFASHKTICTFSPDVLSFKYAERACSLVTSQSNRDNNSVIWDIPFIRTTDCLIISSKTGSLIKVSVYSNTSCSCNSHMAFSSFSMDCSKNNAVILRFTSSGILLSANICRSFRMSTRILPFPASCFQTSSDKYNFSDNILIEDSLLPLEIS